MMTTYLTYRNGSGPVQDRIKCAVAHFRQTNGGNPPAAIVVHPSEVADARAATATLGLEVRGIGGCLVPEVWLELPKANGDQDLNEQVQTDVGLL